MEAHSEEVAEMATEAEQMAADAEELMLDWNEMMQDAEVYVLHDMNEYDDYPTSYSDSSVAWNVL